ncbi:MAG: cytochrome c [Alphaproteobacteria bacterium]|nr:cytochrome c [Alphaproteobacteria bacterium]MBL6940345.1 cytochrome c [Alphaproteobacteria bacterium]MBL7098197.1 cytochrome c [Alphaproteobacteria bacterium]
MSKNWKYLSIALLAVLALSLAYAAIEISGGYDVAADTPHGALAFWLADTTRDNSVASRARGIIIPSGFGSDAQVKEGASEYAEMCAQCHLAPGMERTEISQGLYPRAPELAHDNDLPPAQQFWIIKHGIKMSGMPAWGVTHNDAILWSIVAFLQKLPTLSPQHYRDMTKDAAEDHDAMGHMPGMER